LVELELVALPCVFELFTADVFEEVEDVDEADKEEKVVDREEVTAPGPTLAGTLVAAVEGRSSRCPILFNQLKMSTVFLLYCTVLYCTVQVYYA